MDLYKEKYIINYLHHLDTNREMIDMTQKTLFGGSRETNAGSVYKSNKYTMRFKARKIIKYKARYINFSQNQLQILDDLMNSGGYKKYIDSSGNLRFSEHSGLIDFNKSHVDKIVISGKTNREDEDDTDILLPQYMEDALDYEYIFHTHPPTPYPGARAVNSVLYEFPSITDLFHFAYHYNEGNLQGSIIMAPEGIYIIKMKKNVKYIEVPTVKIEHKMTNLQFKIQEKAIEQYGSDFKDRQDVFYKEVAQDLKYIKYFNNLVKKYFNPNMVVLYKPREYDNKTNKWIVKNLYVKVSPIEIEYK